MAVRRFPVRTESAMRVIPVIDLLDGVVVRGRGRARAKNIVRFKANSRPTHKPATVASAFVTRFGFDAVYVADLNCNPGRPSGRGCLEAIADSGLKTVARRWHWRSGGVHSPSRLALVAGIPKLTSSSVLKSLQDPNDEQWPDALVVRPGPLFSLDLKEGVPIHRIPKWRGQSALEIARAAHALGFSDVILLDLADVGRAEERGRWNFAGSSSLNYTGPNHRRRRRSRSPTISRHCPTPVVTLLSSPRRYTMAGSLRMM